MRSNDQVSRNRDGAPSRRRSEVPPPRDRDDQSISAISYFRDVLARMDNPPRLHVNGKQFPFALVTLDFGQGANSYPSPDTADLLMDHLRHLAKAIVGREQPVRIHKDGSAGIWWAST